jgi:Domain of unknown function (DUF4845)
MKRTQRGVTMIGWICLLIPVAIVGYSAIRLIPVYLNYTKIMRSMDQIAKETRASDTGQTIRYALEKRLDIEQVDFPDVKDFDIHREGQTWIMAIDYEDSTPLLSNVYITAKFSKSVRIGDQGE